MTDKKHQKATNLTKRNNHTGLTPIQEQAAILLASGESITAVSERLNINRSTLYTWREFVAFKCFFNQQRADYRDTLVNGLFGIVDEALEAIRGCLKSDNDSTRLKAAMWVAEKLSLIDIGKTNVREALKEQFTTITHQYDFTEFDEDGFQEELERLGLGVELDEVELGIDPDSVNLDLLDNETYPKP